MKVEDIKTYLQLERDRRWNIEGISMREIADRLGCCERSAQRWVKKEIAEGRMFRVGARTFVDSSGRNNQRDCYQVIPHEV